MPRKVFATVCGEEYHSKTKLQAAWRERVRKYPHPTTALGHKLTGKRADVARPKATDVEWFVTAAAAVQGHAKYLFGAVCSDRLFASDPATRAAELAKALEHTGAYVASVPSGMGTSRKASSFGRGKYGSNKRKSQHRCVYFTSLTNPQAKDRAVPLTLGETEQVKAKKVCTRWLRQTVSSQIRMYVARRKFASNLKCTQKYTPYSCDICGRSCKSKENHVDHGTGPHSFKELVKRFEAEVLQRPCTGADGDSEFIVHKWQQFHKQHAKLSLTCAQCNLKNK